jgi:hypothetical protein
MKVYQKTLCAGLIGTLLATYLGCQGAPGTDMPHAGTAPQFALLEREPANSRGVLEVRSDLEDGAAPDQWSEIVLVGRIGSIEGETWDPNRAAFVIVDQSYVEPEQTHDSPQHDADNCPFCRANRKKAFASSALVEILDADGQIPAMHAGRLLGVDQGQTVVLQGQGRIDALGNLAVRATGVYVPGEGAGN